MTSLSNSLHLAPSRFAALAFAAALAATLVGCAGTRILDDSYYLGQNAAPAVAATVDG